MRRVRLGAVLLSQLADPRKSLLNGTVMVGFSAVWRCLCRPSVPYESASGRSAPASLTRHRSRGGTCLSTFRQSLYAPVATALLAVPLLFGLTAETQAQNRVLVSTIGQTNASGYFRGSPVAITSLAVNGLADHGQSFTTGTNSAGYRLSSADIQFGRIATGLTYTARIQRVGTGGRPDGVVGTFITPSFSTSTTDQTLRFAAPTDGIALEASTEYFLVLDVSGTRTNQNTSWRNTQSDDEDSTGLNDWTVDNEHVYRASSGTDLNWRDNLISSSLKFRLNGEVLIPPGVTTAVTGGTAIEGSTADASGFTVVLDSQPKQAVTVTVTAPSGLVLDGPDGSTAFTASEALGFTTGNWDTAQMVAVRATDDATDSPGSRDLMVNYATASTDSSYSGLRDTAATVKVIDNDPTSVTLARTGTGAISEGGAATLTVTLGRDLIAGERVLVPLTVGGTGITAGDYTLALATGGGLNAGVSLVTTSPHSAARPAVMFTGGGATERTATLRLTAVDDADREIAETFSVGFGTVTSNLDRADSSMGTGGTTTAGAPVAIAINPSDAGGEPVIGIAQPVGEGTRTRRKGLRLYGEAEGSITFTVTATPAPISDLTVCLNVMETLADRVATMMEGATTVTIPAATTATSAATHAVSWSDTALDERDSRLEITVVPPSDAACGQTGYTVSATEESEAIWIADDDPTSVTLVAGSDTAMTEGDATDTATVTVSMGRRLFAGESATVPVDLSSVTGLALPGTAMPDFAVSVSGEGAAIADAASASPDVVFTGHDTDTVQMATVTFTPVANRNDGDSAHERLSATLASDSLLGASSQSGLGGGMERGAGFQAFLSMADDDATSAPGLTLNETSLRLSENGGVARYSVALNAAPTHDATVEISLRGTHSGAVELDGTSLTFTPSNWMDAQTVTLNSVDEEAMHRDRMLTAVHEVSSTDPRFNGLEVELPAEVLDAPEVTAYEPFGMLRKPKYQAAGAFRPPLPMNEFYSAIRRDVLVAEALDYHIHVSNRPVGGAVTVTATIGNFSAAGLALTRDGTPQESLTLTFTDAAAPGGRCSPFGQEGASGSWRCNRKVWIIRKLPASAGGCTDISHSVSGGGVRTGAEVGDIRAQLARHALRMMLPCGFIDIDAYPPVTPELRIANAGLAQMSEASVPPGKKSGSPLGNLPLPVFEGGTARFTIDLGRAVKAGETIALTLDLSGATPGEDYTLALVDEEGDGNSGVSVSGNALLSGARPVLVFAEGAQTAELVLTVRDDAVFERETLKVAFWELRQSVKGVTEPEVSEPEGSLVFALIDSTGPPLTVMGLDEDAAVAENTPWSAAPWLEGGVNGTVIWTLTGEDAARFELDAVTGALTLAARDYEVPEDADGDNVYEAILAATDPGGSHAVAFTVTVTDAAIEPLTVRLAADAVSMTEDNGRVPFTVTLGRALGPGETVRVPFTVTGGRAYRDWNVVFRGKESGAGVTRTGRGNVSEVTFTERGRVARMVLVARPNTDTDTRVIAIAFGADESAPSATGVAEGVVALGDALSIMIVDDDAAAPPALSVEDARARESEGKMRFTVRLNRPATEVVEVRARTRETRPASALAGKDYIARRVTLRFRPGRTALRVLVPLVDDSIDEGRETFELVLSNAEGARIANRVATGTVINDDPLPGAYLSRFGRTVGSQITDAISDRVRATKDARAREPALEITLGGQALPRISLESETRSAESGDRAATSSDAAPELDKVVRALTGVEEPPGTSDGHVARALTGTELLRGTSFMMTAPEDAQGGQLALWGRVAHGRFDGRQDGPGTPVTVNGEVTTGMLGLDYAREWLTFGANLSRSEGEGGYTTGGEDGLSGMVESRLTALTPWISLRVTERFAPWAALGFGNGEMTLTPGNGRAIATGIDWRMASLGVRGNLMTTETGLSLGLTSDALWVRTTSDGARSPSGGGLAASSSDVSRLRLGLEGALRRDLASGGTLAPRLEMGLRHDGGDAETGFGLELGGGFDWADTAGGLSLGLEGRTLVLHEDEGIKDWGLSLTFAYDPHPKTKRGFSTSVTRGLGGGASSGGISALLDPQAFPDVIENGGGEAWSLEATYGASRGRGMVGSPYGALRGDGSMESVRLGYRIEPDALHAADMNVDLWAEPRVGVDGETTAGASMEWQW